MARRKDPAELSSTEREAVAKGAEPVTDENAVRPARRRLAKTSEAPAKRTDVDPLKAPENAVRPVARQAGKGESTTPRGEGMPPEVRDRFVQLGKHFYFPDGAHAFTDRGRKLVTPSENTEVIRNLVEIAKARGWDAVAVTGSERFRKEVWAAGQLAGLGVRGYAANEFEREQLARAVARRRQSAERGDEDGQPVRPPAGEERTRRKEAELRSEDRLIAGRLIDHGRAPYLHRSGEPSSYFVEIETVRGPRTIWGSDLERALRESLTQPKAGDAVRLQVTAQDDVTIKRLMRGEDGRSLEMKEAQARRNRWIVEKEGFFEERAAAAKAIRDPAVKPQTAVRERPELTGTYLYLKGAEEVAKQKIRDPKDRERFVALVRGALADAVERGEPLPVVRLRDRQRHVERILDDRAATR
jgi:putative DNA primase/helicase